ncbi:hypothetical protein C8J57DRAFT_1237363 [Mycena rebaudengoi]|nr:hypothetical protein C8J57DRAFT_1237363 [Mycena rebaudengoi]
MPRRNWKKDKAARARAGKHPQESNSDSETDDCHWDGTEGDKVPQFIPSISHPEYEESFNSTEWDCEDGSLPEEDQSASSDSDRDLQGAELLEEAQKLVLLIGAFTSRLHASLISSTLLYYTVILSLLTPPTTYF